MKRQNIRKLLLIISLLLFPITIWYMSPYLIIQGAMEGIVSGSFIVFLCMLFGSVFFGRVFCGWLCPMGGMQECLFSVNDKVPKQGLRNYIKYVIWIIRYCLKWIKHWKSALNFLHSIAKCRKSLYDSDIKYKRGGNRHGC